MKGWNRPLPFPTLFGRLLSYFFPLLGRHPRSPRLAAHAPQRHGGGVLAVLGGDVLDLAGGDLGDHDGVADGVGRALLALRASGHRGYPLRQSISLLRLELPLAFHEGWI